MLGIETGLYPVKHQAFITKRLPLLGKEGTPLDMLIDRRHYKGFSAVYGQQLADTGQIIGCASPATDPAEAGKDLRINTQAFLEIASEVFSEWIPALKEVGIQATWAGYYVEPRYIVDPALAPRPSRARVLQGPGPQRHRPQRAGLQIAYRRYHPFRARHFYVTPCLLSGIKYLHLYHLSSRSRPCCSYAFNLNDT